MPPQQSIRARVKLVIDNNVEAARQAVKVSVFFSLYCSLCRFKWSERKVLPRQPSILEFAGDLPVLVPPEHSEHNHTHRIAGLCSLRKIIRGSGRRVSRQLELDQILQNRETAWRGTSSKTYGYDGSPRSQLDEITVDIVPGVAVYIDDTESWKGDE